MEQRVEERETPTPPFAVMAEPSANRVIDARGDESTSRLFVEAAF